MGRIKINDTFNVKIFLIRDLPIDVHAWLKREAIKNKTTISKVITQLVHEAAASRSQKKTGQI
jgi:hypothetical protein